MGEGRTCPGLQQDEDPGTEWGCSSCTWVCTGAVGAERMAGGPSPSPGLPRPSYQALRAHPCPRS